MEQARYDKVARRLHWLIGTLLIVQIVFGFCMDEIAPRNTPARAGVINNHKSFGIVLGLLILWRLYWRLRHSPPAWPAALPRWQQLAAHWGHIGLYVCMLVMPLSGYVGSNFSKHGIKFFGTPLPPWGPDLPTVYKFFNGVHVVTAFVFAALIAGHILAAIQHMMARDGTLHRISLASDKD
ncbi:cytochrome b [Pelomonas sp. KK5]|uniref:cytochrome b n=1 Tax=Pelomonas sp. KK5 TaxID=1855730 RepID=UPI0009FA3EE6|nr:cytochrome b [Pelomonas sp. KK5]